MGLRKSLHPAVHGVFLADDYELLDKPLEKKKDYIAYVLPSIPAHPISDSLVSHHDASR